MKRKLWTMRVRGVVSMVSIDKQTNKTLFAGTLCHTGALGLWDGSRVEGGTISCWSNKWGLLKKEQLKELAISAKQGIEEEKVGPNSGLEKLFPETLLTALNGRLNSRCRKKFIANKVINNVALDNCCSTKIWSLRVLLLLVPLKLGLWI
jgi:hypothetical protein